MGRYEKTLLFICFFLVLFVLTGCDSSSSSQRDDKTVDITLSGHVVNGPLAGATVTIYDNEDFSIGTTETDEEGFFSIEGIPDSPPYLIVAEGGTVNGQSYTGTLAGRFETTQCNVTPLTTVIEDLSNKQEREYAEVKNEIMNWLGFDEDPFMADFEGTPIDTVDLEPIRAAITEHGLDGWVAQLISFFEDDVPAEDRGKDWFGEKPADSGDQDPDPEKYNIEFNDYDGSLIDTQTVNHGGSATAPADPTREGYTFTGWDVSFDNVTEDMTVTPQYGINTYTVTFEDHDGIELKSETVDHGSDATAPVNPTREGYTFTGWDVSFDNVTEGMTVTAQYGINTYTVTFEDHGGTVIESQTVNHGGSATAPADPTREGYIFTGWDNAFDNVTEDITVTAQYSVNQYTVTFQDHDGTEIESQTIDHGDNATAPADSTREGYTFAGWDNGFDNVTADLTVTAQYAINTYEITTTTGEGGSISPSSVLLPHFSTAAFTVTPATGHIIESVTGCNGTLEGKIYTTGTISGGCTVDSKFSPIEYVVNTFTTGGGSADPESLTLKHGDFASIDFYPDNRNSILDVSGCNGVLRSNSYDIGPITADCDVFVEFGILYIDQDIEWEPGQVLSRSKFISSGTTVRVVEGSELFVDPSASIVFSGELEIVGQGEVTFRSTGDEPWQGFEFRRSSQEFLSNLRIVNARVGIRVISSEDLRIIGNIFENNETAIRLQTDDGNRSIVNGIYQNEFIGGLFGVSAFSTGADIQRNKFLVSEGAIVLGGGSCGGGSNCGWHSYVHDNLIAESKVGIQMTGHDIEIIKNDLFNLGVALDLHNYRNAYYVIDKNNIGGWRNHGIINRSPADLHIDFVWFEGLENPQAICDVRTNINRGEVTLLESAELFVTAHGFARPALNPSGTGSVICQ